MVKLPGVDFHWLYGLTDGKTTATSCAIRMVGGLPGGKPMGMFLSSVRVSSWSVLGWVWSVEITWRKSGRRGTAPLGSGASVVRRCRRLRPGGVQVGGVASPHCQHKVS